MNTTTSQEMQPSPSPTNKGESESGTIDGADLSFPVETDIFIHANGDVTIADLPDELVELASLLQGESTPKG